MAQSPTQDKGLFADWWKNILALLVGLLIALLGLVAAQYIFSQRSVKEGSQESPVEEKATVPYYDNPIDVFGWSLVPNIVTRVTRYRDHWVIYEATYTIDDFRRRRVFFEDRKEAKQFLLFLGGSNMMGQGLEDMETLDYQLTSRFAQFQSYNYAVPGYGLGHVMAQAENIDFKSQISQRKGLILYLFPTYHVDRLVGGLQTIDWGEGLPQYKLVEDKVVRDGFIHQDRWLYANSAKAWNKTFLRRKMKLTGPFGVSQKDLQLACRVLAEVKRNIQNQFEESEFLLVLHPGSKGMDLTFCLEQYEIKWLDLRNVFDGYDRQEVSIKGDGHTSQFGNRILANKIEEHLRELGY